MNTQKLLQIVIINILFLNITFANTIFIGSNHNKVANGSNLNLSVYIDATQNINAVEGMVKIPKGVVIKSIQDGDSTINIWIEKPFVDSSGNIRFAGITPGGFVGKVKIFDFIINTANTGEYNFASSEIKTYLNNGEGTEAKINTKPQTLAVSPEYVFVDDSVEDKLGPDYFTISIVNEPLINDGKYSVIFATNDKGVGIDRYEMTEVKSIKKEDEIIYPKNPNWKIVESPVLLSDQNLKSHIFVRAIDKNGNETVAYLAPTNKSNYNYLFIIITVLLLLCYYKYNKVIIDILKSKR